MEHSECGSAEPTRPHTGTDRTHGDPPVLVLQASPFITLNASQGREAKGSGWWRQCLAVRFPFEILVVRIGAQLDERTELDDSSEKPMLLLRDHGIGKHR